MLMESQQIIQRLAAFVNESSYQFALRHSDCTKRGALLQCWVPREQGRQRVLTTQEAPFAILGSSDQLARYKYESSKHHPSCDGADADCAVSRVFANVQAGLTRDASSQPSNGFDRTAEAQSCGIHSNLLLGVYDEEGEGDSSSSSSDCEPVAVLELAMHEVDVDFSQTCTTLREVAQGHGFWLPCLRSARSLDMQESVSASAATLEAAEQETRITSAPLPSIDAVSGGSASSSMQPNKERVRALVAHGGAFRHTGLDGMWSYVGGAQKLVGVPKHASIAELQGQLAGNTLSCASVQFKIKYALPSSPRAVGAGPTYVDLESEEDVEIIGR
ncbi:hypothetical protein OEZ85_006957 [Tetradesmus obliquus]|uniref:Uncharacterized protein n=1 Tax=Tetradesmus obliquus TaxID=3088 RepID=A0ABY8TWK6_TETOB|nr:hypothetical protein OEZ85_006957 [Tetradesmus obliquus]